MSTTKRCYYETLEVDRNADESKLKAAFRKLAMKWHPDNNPGDATSEIRFKEINEAYDVLKDGDKRAAYDRFGHAAFEQGHGGGGRASAPALPRPFRIFSKTCSAWPGSADAAAARARRRPALQHGNHAGGGLPRQDRADRDSGLGHLRILLGHRRQGRHQAEDLLDVRRRRPGAAGAGLLHAGANLPGLPGPRPDDRGSLSVLLGLRPGDARAHSVGQYSARRRRRHPHPAGRRRRGRRPRRAARRSLYFPVAGDATSSSSATAPTCTAGCRSRW